MSAVHGKIIHPQITSVALNTSLRVFGWLLAGPSKRRRTEAAETEEHEDHEMRATPEQPPEREAVGNDNPSDSTAVTEAKQADAQKVLKSYIPVEPFIVDHGTYWNKHSVMFAVVCFIETVPGPRNQSASYQCSQTREMLPSCYLVVERQRWPLATSSTICT